MAKKKATKFVCQACGYESPKWMGRCPNCGSWNQMEEETMADKNDRRSRVSMTGKAAKAEAIQDINVSKVPRIKTQLKELNRVLGGGVVPGSLVLIGETQVLVSLHFCCKFRRS